MASFPSTFHLLAPYGGVVSKRHKKAMLLCQEAFVKSGLGRQALSQAEERRQAHRSCDLAGGVLRKVLARSSALACEPGSDRIGDCDLQGSTKEFSRRPDCLSGEKRSMRVRAASTVCVGLFHPAAASGYMEEASDYAKGRLAKAVTLALTLAMLKRR